MPYGNPDPGLAVLGLVFVAVFVMLVIAKAFGLMS